MFGIQKSFAYLGLADSDSSDGKGGSVMQREWDCWCPACFCSIAGPAAQGSLMVNNGEGQGYVVTGCTSQEKWYDCTVQRKDAVGVHVRRQLSQQVGQKLAKTLKPGDWIAVQDRRTVDPVFPFMIGRARCADGSTDGEQGCVVETLTEKKTIDGQRFDAGDSLVAVEWSCAPLSFWCTLQIS